MKLVQETQARVASALREAPEWIQSEVEAAAQGLPGVAWHLIIEGMIASLYDGIPPEACREAAILSARSLIERHPDYSYVAARLLLNRVYQTVFQCEAINEVVILAGYRSGFAPYLRRGVAEGHLDSELLSFDLEKLSAALEPAGDAQFLYQGMQILMDRYLIRDREQRLMECPQWLWMRVAMGLSILEEDKDARAIEFYGLMKNFRYIPSTPTLFSAGTPRAQLSSCFLNTVDDSLEGIFKTYTDNARLSKWAGGIGTDWTPVRATGTLIVGTNGQSQGVIPWLKIDNDVALAVNQGGKRKGAHCAYLETWHLDMEDFLELRKNVGDERRRTHDINTANWIPDLFMKRVQADSHWTLFSPSDVPELHDLYGAEFERAYVLREEQHEAELIPGKRMEAKALWRKMLTMLFETGHPWLTFKDPCNVRSPQDHVGVVHSSNLCTEITLNTHLQETAVCNLGSINLARHLGADGAIDLEALAETIRVAVRMLDNVIDINYYPTPEAERANRTHRAIGLGVMGYQDLLYELDIPFASESHLELANDLFEHVSYYAIEASAQLAEERGAYATFQGSKWQRGLFPQDTLSLLETERGLSLSSPFASPFDGTGQTYSRPVTLDWAGLKQRVSQGGLRHSNMMAIAPTATISNIIGTSPCIEPGFKNLYVTSNMSGEFTVINRHLVRDLEAQGLWSQEMIEQLKAVDGQLSRIPDMPEAIRAKYPDVFELDQRWLIRAAAVRGQWIDQSQSLNLFVAQPSGKYLHQLYMDAWQMGLKTTYYLRTLGASQVEKSTVDTAQYGRTHQRETAAVPQSCAIDNPECEACQ